VHDRLLELAARLREELPAIRPGSQAATVLGISGPLDIRIEDRGPGRIEWYTTQGRIRGEGTVDIAPAGDDRTSVSVAAEITPQGFAGNLVLATALRAMPGVEGQVVEAIEANLDSLAVELAKPDQAWDPASWQPEGLPIPSSS
jgi:hypothetical protein